MYNTGAARKVGCQGLQQWEAVIHSGWRDRGRKDCHWKMVRAQAVEKGWPAAGVAVSRTPGSKEGGRGKRNILVCLFQPTDAFHLPNPVRNDKIRVIQSLCPRWISGKECRRHGFDPWVGNIPWRRKWQPTPVFFHGKFHGQRGLKGYSPFNCKESDMTE